MDGWIGIFAHGCPSTFLSYPKLIFHRAVCVCVCGCVCVCVCTCTDMCTHVLMCICVSSCCIQQTGYPRKGVLQTIRWYLFRGADLTWTISYCRLCVVYSCKVLQICDTSLAFVLDRLDMCTSFKSRKTHVGEKRISKASVKLQKPCTKRIYQYGNLIVANALICFVLICLQYWITITETNSYMLYELYAFVHVLMCLVIWT